MLFFNLKATLFFTFLGLTNFILGLFKIFYFLVIKKLIFINFYKIITQHRYAIWYNYYIRYPLHYC